MRGYLQCDIRKQILEVRSVQSQVLKQFGANCQIDKVDQKLKLKKKKKN